MSASQDFPRRRPDPAGQPPGSAQGRDASAGLPALRETLHQPPNPADLLRRPPANAACATVRGWLRDFADNDLEPQQRHKVEDHVHLCRVCAVELARAEHEVMRLRRAFAASRQIERGLAPGFAARVVERLVLDETSLVSAEALAAVPRLPDAPVGPDSGSFDGARRRAWGGPLRWLFVGLGLLLAVGSAMFYATQGDGAPEHLARLVVVQAESTFGARGRLLSGDGLGELQSLWVKRGGEARLVWHDLSAKEQPAANLQVHGASELRLQNGEPLLVNGQFEVQTRRPVSIPMADGSRIDLGIGEYVIAAELASDPFGDRSTPPSDSLALPADLRVEVEVLRGDDANVVRPQIGGTLIAAGSTGIYEGNGGVRIRRSDGPSPVAFNDQSPRENSAPNPAEYGTFSGRVVDRLGQPGAGAAVLAAFVSGGEVQLVPLQTNANGTFGVQTNALCDSPFAVVQVYPPSMRFDLGMVAPDAVAVATLGAHTELASPLFLEASLPFLGSVRDQYQVPRAGVRVLPFVVDELFGDVWALSDDSGVTIANGTFQLNRLPARLPYYQHLALLLLHPELEPTVVPIPARNGPNAVASFAPFEVQRLQTVRFEMGEVQGGLPASITMWEEIPGLPPGTAVVQRTVQPDAQGLCVLRVGQGTLWWRLGSASAPPALRRLHRFEEPGQVTVYRPMLSDVPFDASQQFRPLRETAHFGLRLASSYRHERVQYAASADGLSLRAVDQMGHNVAGAQVFAVGRHGPRGTVEQRFLGLTTSTGQLSLQAVVDSGDDLFVLGADGSTGEASMILNAGLQVTVDMAPWGRVMLDASLRPTGAQDIVTITFERAEAGVAGMAMTAVRFASLANGWEVQNLQPGEYRALINGVSHAVTVPSSGFATLH